MPSLRDWDLLVPLHHFAQDAVLTHTLQPLPQTGLKITDRPKNTSIFRAEATCRATRHQNKGRPLGRPHHSHDPNPQSIFTLSTWTESPLTCPVTAT